MNMPISNPTPFTAHIMLETLADGQIAAWVAEVPDCRVIGESKASAIAAMEVAYAQRLQGIEIITLPNVNVENVSSEENPWASSYGVLKDDAEFHAWAERFWEEKQLSHDDEPTLSLEECLQVI
jgi:hypothetical protein